MSEKEQALELALGQIERQFGKGSIMKMGDKTSLSFEVISTGSISLDAAIGIGGVPKGKMVSPQIQELFMLVEDLYKSVEKIEVRIEDMMHNKVNIQFLQKNQEKILSDLEELKDKVRANRNGAH